MIIIHITDQMHSCFKVLYGISLLACSHARLVLTVCVFREERTGEKEEVGAFEGRVWGLTCSQEVCCASWSGVYYGVWVVCPVCVGDKADVCTV